MSKDKENKNLVIYIIIMINLFFLNLGWKIYYRFLNGVIRVDANLKLNYFCQDLIKDPDFSKEKYDIFFILLP